ncbi:MAG TPA: TraB/GumN family protein [Deltaproteobacteria bacterium]|jgi:hypothetical protein|nr:TraB/GumN family protein [Deltaproteobacteria bacterium]
MKKILLTACSLVFILSSAASAGQGSHAFLWSVATPKGSVYLLGSAHVPGIDADKLDKRIVRAYQKSRRVVFEADLQEMADKSVQKALFANGTYQGKETLKGNISKETYELLMKRLKGAGIPPSRFETYKPWLCAVSLSGVELKRLGYDPKSGIEARFYTEAKKDGKETVFLETSRSQINLLSRKLKDRQEELLKQAMEELDVVKSRSADIVKAWKSGDAKAMDAITSISLDEYPEIRRALFDERNAAWVSSIEKQMKKDGDTLVIVGAGHLVGEEGILSLLQKKGYNPVQQ